MKKQFRAFLALFALMVCLSCGLAAPAQAAGLPHAEAVQASLGYSDSTRHMIDNVWITLTNYGGPYRCTQAEERSVVQMPGDAPAKDAVATLQIYVRADDSDSRLNISGHAFLYVQNVSDTEQMVGGMTLAPGTSISLGTYGNTDEHSGLWYGLECFSTVSGRYSYDSSISIQTSLNAEQLAVLNQNLARADHWSTVHNCASFVVAMWNSVCADTVEPAMPYSPATLKADIMQRYAGAYTHCLPLRCDYPVRYGTALTLSEEFC